MLDSPSSSHYRSSGSPVWYTPPMPAKPRKPLLLNLTWAGAALLGLVMLYVLSYAPVFRVVVGTDNLFRPRYLGHLPGYGPVEWLVDNSSLNQPLLWWGGVWGCREIMANSKRYRAWREAGAEVSPREWSTRLP